MENLQPSAAAILESTSNYWTELCQNLPANVLSAAPAPAEWSALECLQHLVDTERMVFPVRVRAFLAGQDFPAYDPDSQGETPAASQSAADLAAEFERLRRDSLALVASLTEADLGRTARHAELGLVTLDEMLHEWAGHDLMHTVQAQEALMQPFIQGCGPWMVYFKDHIAG